MTTRRPSNLIALVGAAGLVVLSPVSGCGTSRPTPQLSAEDRARLDEINQAREAQRETLQQYQAEARRLRDQALRQDEAGDRRQAIETLRGALALDAQLPGGHAALGAMLMEEGRYDDAQRALLIAAELAPGDPRPAYELGRLELENAWPSRALPYFERSLEIQDKYQPALRGYVLAASAMRRTDQELLDIIRDAQLGETDPAWRTYLDRQRFRVQQELPRQRPE